MATDNLVYLSGRISFPWIVEQQKVMNGKPVEFPSYNCDIIFPPNDPGFAKFMQVYAMLAAEKWKENAQAAMQRIQSDRKTRCYGAGEEKVSGKTFQIHPGYAGNVFISARNERQPQIIGLDGKQIDPTNTMQIRAEASKMIGGMYVNAVLKPWCQQNDKGIGLRCDLIALQFAREGEPLGSGAGAVDTTGMFGAVAAGAPVAAPAPAMPIFGAAPAVPAFAAPAMPSFLS